MSLDNVLAVAGIARDHFWLLAFGLVLSVALMGVASTWIARLLDRHVLDFLGRARDHHLCRAADDLGRLDRDHQADRRIDVVVNFLSAPAGSLREQRGVSSPP